MLVSLDSIVLSLLLDALDSSVSSALAQSTAEQADVVAMERAYELILSSVDSLANAVHCVISAFLSKDTDKSLGKEKARLPPRRKEAFLEENEDRKDIAVAIAFQGQDLVRHIQWLSCSEDNEQAVVSQRPKVLLFNANNNISEKKRSSPFSSPSKGPKSPLRRSEGSKKETTRIPSLAGVRNALRVLWNENMKSDTFSHWLSRSRDEISDARLSVQVL